MRLIKIHPIGIDPSGVTVDRSDPAGWIAWSGGDCPVPADTPVQIRLGIEERFDEDQPVRCRGRDLALGPWRALPPRQHHPLSRGAGMKPRHRTALDLRPLRPAEPARADRYADMAQPPVETEWTRRALGGWQDPAMLQDQPPTLGWKSSVRPASPSFAARSMRWRSARC